MIHKTRSNVEGHVHILFELPASFWADQVSVIGDFNQWTPTETPMHQAVDGHWRAGLDLPVRSRYRYCYWIDGVWRTDCQTDGYASCPNGLESNIVETTLPLS